MLHSYPELGIVYEVVEVIVRIVLKMLLFVCLFSLMFRKVFLEHPKDQTISKSPNYADFDVFDHLKTHFPT